MDYEIRCSSCKHSSLELIDFRCPSCGQPLEVRHLSEFQVRRVRKRIYTVWRYAKFFPMANEADIVTLGEGWTPLVRFSKSLCFKLESLNPTGSFKDRGSTILISALHMLVKKAGGHVSEDSSGNAGASIAAYAARAGLKARIYVPENVSGPKFNQIQFYGAEVIKVKGSRGRVAEEAQKARKTAFYIGHILHPLFRDGIRSLAYEIAEQTNWHCLDSIYLPVSAGTLLLGVIDGFRHLVESGSLKSMPRIVACQTRQVSPLYHLFKGLAYHPRERLTSVADALVSVNPPLLNLMSERLKAVNGDVVMVEENEILEAFRKLARSGFFVEPSSAVAFAGYKKQLRSREASKSDKAVVILTGAGLKTSLSPERLESRHLHG
jgi:threonine synthase